MNDEEMPKGEDDPEEAGIRLVEEDDDDDEEKVKDNRTVDESEEGRKGHVRSDMGFMMIRRRMDGQGGLKLKKAKAKAKKGNTSYSLVIHTVNTANIAKLQKQAAKGSINTMV